MVANPTYSPPSTSNISTYVKAIGETFPASILLGFFEGPPSQANAFKKNLPEAPEDLFFDVKADRDDKVAEPVCGWAINAKSPEELTALLINIFTACRLHDHMVTRLTVLDVTSDGRRHARVIAGPGAEAMADGREGEEVIQDVALANDSQAPQVIPAAGAEGGAQS
jgi:hypothetical protein